MKKVNDKTKTMKAFIAAATILIVVAMIGIQTQMSQYALAKHTAKDPPVIPESHAFVPYSGYLPTESNVAPGCQGNPSCTG
jgi:hypothetical protein